MNGCCPTDGPSVSCNDWNVGTYGDHCNGSGTCIGTPVTCPANTTCASYSPNGTSTCQPTNAPATKTCDDGNACTFGDHCSGLGTCIGTAISCTSTTCRTQTCNGSATCTIANGNGNVCSDGNACTVGDQCNGAGVCVGTLVSMCSTTVCQTQPCSGVTDFVNTIRVDASGQAMVTFLTPVAPAAPCCVAPQCFPGGFAFDTNTAGGKAALALVTAAKLGGKKVNAIGTGTCNVYGGWSEDLVYGTLVGP